MPIKSLESYLFERKLAVSSSIEILQNATIGIDVEHYLSRIYTFKKEQFLSGIGGAPSSLKDYILSDLQVFKEFNIKPLFVISGLNIQLQSSQYNTNELSTQEQHLENTWSKLQVKQPYSYNNNESFRLFSDPLPIRPIANDLIKLFIELGIDYLVAPYDASFQLSYLYQSKVIDSIYGSTDLLLTKIDKFILGMEFQSKDFRFVDKRKVLHELNLSERQFLDLSIMVGCNIQKTTFPNFPPLPKPNPVQPYPQLSYFKLGLDIIYQYNSFSGNNTNNLYGFIAGLNDPHILELYFKGHAAIKFLPVLNKEGYVELYNVEMAKLGFESNTDFINDDENTAPSTGDEHSDVTTPDASENGESKHKTVKVPTDVHEIISQRLPPELYFYQSIGLLPIDLLEGITRGHFNVRPNLECGLTDSYKKLITSTQAKDLLDSQCNLITQLLARYYQVKKVSVKYWFKDEVLEVNNRLTPPIFTRLEKLFIKSDSASDKFSLTKFFKQLPLQGEYTTSGLIKSNEDVLSTVLLRTLFLYKIVDQKTLALTSVGKILKRYVEENVDVTETDLQQLTLLLLLVLSKTMVLTESTREFSNVPKFFKDDNEGPKSELSSQESKFITLISRVFSLQKLNITPINYQGPISRNLLNFRSHLKFVSSSFISTIQCLLADFIVRQEKNSIKTEFSERSDWSKLIDQIPFYKDVNSTLLGVVAEIYFEYALNQTKAGKSKEESIAHAKDHLLNDVYQVTVPAFHINVFGTNAVTGDQLFKDIGEGVLFWNKFLKLAKIVNEDDKTLINDNYYGDIAAADEWMKGYVPV